MLPIPPKDPNEGLQTSTFATPGDPNIGIDWSRFGLSSTPTEEWRRSTKWGGHVVWNPQYGWQDAPTVAGKYKANTPFSDFGLTPQGDSDWRKYYGDRPVWTHDEKQAMDAGWDPGTGMSFADWQTQQSGGGGGGGREPIVGPGSQHPPGYRDPAPGGSNITLPNMGSFPGQYPTNQTLGNFGYTGPVGMNPFENAALDFTNQMYQTQGPLRTMAPGMGFYGDVLNDKYAPQGQAFRGDVYDATKNVIMSDLSEAQQNLGDIFSHRGGFFGGKHAVAQSDLGRKAMGDLSSVLANLNLSGYNTDLTSKFGAASGLQGLGGAQQNVMNSILSNLQTGGNLMAGREMTNRADYMNAYQRAYEDWTRARGESMYPFSMAQTLLGYQPTQPIVQQPAQSGWGSFLGGLGQGIGQIPGLL